MNIPIRVCREWLCPAEGTPGPETCTFKDRSFQIIENAGRGGCGYTAVAEGLNFYEVAIPRQFHKPADDGEPHVYAEWGCAMAMIDPTLGRYGYKHTHTHTHTRTHNLCLI